MDCNAIVKNKLNPRQAVLGGCYWKFIVLPSASLFISLSVLQTSYWPNNINLIVNVKVFLLSNLCINIANQLKKLLRVIRSQFKNVVSES